MTRFRTRLMEPGDEIAFNDAYNALGVAPFRPIAEMRHVWHNAPGGKVRSWIIEAEEEPGRWRLIGHHGLCPVRFTFGDQDLLFAKTVNSFLVPEFKSRFVYLRFEQRCLAQVEQDFDATYTLAGMAARMRGALGYDTSILELDLEQGLRVPAILSRLLMRTAWRFPRLKLVRPWRGLPKRPTSLALTALDSTAARASPFFLDFWQGTRATAGLAPRRDIADLAWRFWDMPGGRCETLVHTWPCGTRGYGIISNRDGLHFTLEDIFLSAPRAELLEQLVDGILSWCAENGGLMLSFMTTAEGQPPELLKIYRRKMGQNFGLRHREQRVSRRLTARGQARVGRQWPPCNITAIAAVA